MSKAAWAKFEEKLKSQGYSFDDVKLYEEDGRKAILIELGIVSELEKGAIITEWKNRLSNEPSQGSTENLQDSVSHMKRPPKKVGFQAKNQKPEEVEEVVEVVSEQARRPTLEATKKINKMKWINDSCINLFGAVANEETHGLGKKELHLLAYSMGYYLDEEALNAAMSLLDTDRDGVISIDEFYRWYRSKNRFLKLEEAKRQEVQIAVEVFMQYDKSRTGSIDHNEWLKLWRQLFGNEGKQGRMKPDYLISAEQYMRELGDKDGKITLDDYLAWLTKVGVIPPVPPPNKVFTKSSGMMLPPPENQ